MNEKIAVIGGGQMGSQIAALAAMAGYTTNIYDENKENLEYRYKFVEENIKNLIDKNIYSEDKLDSYKENLKLTYSLKDVIEEKSFVIEAVVERFDVKLEIFKQISKLLESLSMRLDDYFGNRNFLFIKRDEWNSSMIIFITHTKISPRTSCDSCTA